MIEPTPTKRAMLDCGKKCNINCKFCYYTHLGDLRKQGWAPLDMMKSQVDLAKRRGNNYIDITGGEPTIYPQMLDLIKYVKDKGMRCCIITNGLCGEKRAEKLIKVGVDDFLVSMHGTPDTHEMLTNNPGGWNKLLNFLATIDSTINFRFNFVMNQYNQAEIINVADIMASWAPRIVNFINVNPYRPDWKDDKDGTRNVIADLRKVEPLLNSAIAMLEGTGIGVNVRYYPLCRIAPEYRRCVCNDLQVAYDPYEWDYPRHPKTMENFRAWSAKCSMENEHKGEPCYHCSMRFQCGGINKNFNEATDGKMINPIHAECSEDFYLFRQHNTTTLEEPE